MANYKVVFKNSLEDGNILWEQGCPLVFEAIQVARNTDTAQSYLQIKIKNVSIAEVKSYSGQVVVTFDNKEEQIIELKFLDADIACGASKILAPVELVQSQVQLVQYAIADVITGAGEWKSQTPPVVVPSKELLGLSEKALKKRESVLAAKQISNSKFALRHAVVAGDDWWVCACGTPNVDRNECAGCFATKEEMQNLESENYLKSLIKKKKGKRKRIVRIVLGIIGFLVFSIIGVYAWGVNELQSIQDATEKIAEGNNLFEEKKFKEAVDVCSSINPGVYNSIIWSFTNQPSAGEDLKSVVTILIQSGKLAYIAEHVEDPDDSLVDKYIEDLKNDKEKGLLNEVLLAGLSTDTKAGDLIDEYAMQRVNVL